MRFVLITSDPTRNIATAKERTGDRGCGPTTYKKVRYLTQNFRKKLFSCFWGQITHSRWRPENIDLALGWVLLGFWLSKEPAQYFTRPPK